MKKVLKWSISITLLVILGIGSAGACTTAVISGKFTKSGRPMIWKLRDTEEYANHMRRFESKIGYYVGLMNDSDPKGEHIWGGHNSHGFAIMNSASFNVNKNDTTDISNQEGVFMKKALAECRNLEEFEALLNNAPKPMGLASHFGVLDAEGGAAFYEVNNYTWKKFDANEDPRGYVIRTNFSYTGDENEGLGYVRHSCASYLFSPIDKGTLTLTELGSRLSRSMYHGLLEIDYRTLAEEDALPSKSGYIDSDDLITRYGTSSMILVEGVAKGDDPSLTTSWVQIGNPYLSPLVPIWTWQEVPTELAMPQDGAEKTMAQRAMDLKKKLYPVNTIEETRYLYMPLIYRKDGEGLAQRLEKLEAKFLPMIENEKDHQKLLSLQGQLIKEGMAIQTSYMD